MKYLILLITFSVCCCSSDTSKKTMKIVFTPGYVEYCDSDIDTDYYFNKVDSVNMLCYKYKISSEAFSYLQDVFKNHKTKTLISPVNPPIYVQIGSTKYIIGDNRVIETKGEKFVISEKDEYKIKCLIHFYDFKYEDDVASFPEVKKYGMPTNYWYTTNTRFSRLPVSDVKIIIEEK